MTSQFTSAPADERVLLEADDVARTLQRIAHELIERNPELEGRTPAELLHEGCPPETVWLAAATPF
jgi:pyrimidine operon attenuation protein/uracil phosphoribosyltransferase